MKKIIFNKLIKDVIKFFLLTSLSLSLIIWVVQAVNFLDYISEDGHGISTYFYITMLNYPKIFTRVMPFCIFISIFYILNKYEVKNELVIFWNIGIKKIKFINILIFFSFTFLILQLLLNTIIVPHSLNSAREHIKYSNIDFFPNLIKEKKFIDVVENLTIFIESKNNNGDLKNIYLKDKIDSSQSQIIYAASGKLSLKNNKNFLILNDGTFIDINNDSVTTFEFKKTEFDLSKYVTKSTTHRKNQETTTKHLLECVYKLNFNQNYNYFSDHLQCNKVTEKEIKEELFKRIAKPFYIPILVFVSSLIIFISKDSFNYSRTQYLLFSTGFFIIIISEVSARYFGNNSNNLFLSLPLITFITCYFYLTFKLHIKS